MKTTIIGEAQRTLNKAKRAFDQSRNAVSDELSRLEKTNQFSDRSLWSDLYYASPNSNQVTGYLAKVAKFVAKCPEASQGVQTLAAAVEAAAQAVAAAKAGLEAAQAQVKADREARLADKGDQNLIAAMAKPRGEYRKRCIKHIQEDIATITVALEAAAYNINAAYPYPGRDIRERVKTIRMIEDRRYAEKFFKPVDQDTVALRSDIEAVIADLAEKMVSNHFDGYIYKLSKKIGKPVAHAAHLGSIWTDCTLIVTCQDGESQTWHTQCIFNRSCLGKIFNQWPTRRS